MTNQNKDRKDKLQIPRNIDLRTADGGTDTSHMEYWGDKGPTNQNNELEEPMPCLGYTSAVRVQNGVRCCMGCEQPLSKHPIPYRTQAPEPNERKMVTIAVDKNLIPTVWCDPDIADLVTALNLAEIPTIASCSGHGLRNGNIALEDGRELIIAESFEEARSMENAIELAKNIRLTRAEPVESGELDERILDIIEPHYWNINF